MKSVYLSSILLIFVLLLGCQEQPVFTSVEKGAVEKEVEGQFTEFVKALGQMDADAWSGYYSKDGFISAFVSTDYYGDRGAFVDVITKYFSMRETQVVEVSKVKVSALAPDLALLTSEEDTEMSLAGGESLKAKHVYSMLWKKELDGWKILHSHESWTEIPVE